MISVRIFNNRCFYGNAILSECKFRLLPILAMIWVSCCSGKAQTNTNQESIPEIPFSGQTVRIDGNLDDWQSFAEFEFSDTATRLYTPNPWLLELSFPDADLKHTRKPLSRNVSTVKCFWNYRGLFFGFTIDDRHLWAEFLSEQENPYIFLNDGIELYIDAKGDSKQRMDINDYQIIVDVRSSIVVFRGKRLLSDSLQMGVFKDYGQNVLVDFSVSRDGSLNDYRPDTGYCVEIRIPFETIGIQPETGRELKIDLCNNDMDFVHRTEVLENPSSGFIWTYNLKGFCDYGFPDFWTTVRLVNHERWWERMQRMYGRAWVFISLPLLVFLAAIVYYLFRRNKKVLHSGNTGFSEMTVLGGVGSTLPKDVHPMLAKAYALIVEWGPENLSSASLAGQLGVSVRTLQRITRDELNCTPTCYIQFVKLGKAAELLRSTGKTISEISWDLGFSSPAYFTSVFKKHFGVSPGDYRKNG